VKRNAQPQVARVAGFRTKLLAAIMLVVTVVTLSALYFAERSLVANLAEDLEREFEAQVVALRHAQDVRSAALVERCRALVRKPRIRAAFEDDALDLLYLTAEDELRDITARSDDGVGTGLRAQFYRFLDQKGRVIAPPNARVVGALAPDEQAKLALPRVTPKPQTGYLVRRDDRGESIAMVMAMPILSIETGEVLGALVLGFRPFDLAASGLSAGMKSGLWMDGRLHAPGLPTEALAAVAREIPRVLAASTDDETSGRLELAGRPHLLFARHLNPESLFPAAYEICVYPLTGLETRQQQLRWQVLGAGALLLLLGWGGSHLMAGRLAVPVERLAVDSEENRTQRFKAEAALEMTSAELQRSARFSADASHQLKTPVTVLRAGLEEWMANEKLTPAECQEIAALIHQTYRLSSLIDDLLLLSRMDSGRLKLALGPVDLSHLIESALDDLSAQPDALEVDVQTEFPPALHILGEQRYTAIILQNLLDNARKYNRAGGRISVRATVEGDIVRLAVGNSGRPIPAAAQAHIFERFHRGAMGENVPGHGLGLNLARELARLHQGDLRLVRSDDEATVFEVNLLAAPVPSAATP
jgi:signal transduction histidine kinase